MLLWTKSSIHRSDRRRDLYTQLNSRHITKQQCSHVRYYYSERRGRVSASKLKIFIGQQNKNFVDLSGGKTLILMDYRLEAPGLIRDFLVYHETIQGHSRRTVDEYYLDLRSFFRFLKREKKLVADNIPFNQIPIDDVTIDLARNITLTDVYAYMNYLSRDRGLSNTSRARKVATIRSFYSI